MLQANFTGKRVRVPASDTATTLGAALLAGVGTGIYPSYAAAVSSTIQTIRVHEPDPANHAHYQSIYQLYRQIYEQLKGTMEAQAELVELANK